MMCMANGWGERGEAVVSWRTTRGVDIPVECPVEMAPRCTCLTS
jgi:hypothetical protein